MEPSLFSFIWKHSRRQQLWLLFLTLVSFPFLYASLELPKLIINDAIGSVTATVTALGVRMTQTQYLFVLCGAFLLVVLIGGLLKMHINTRKGVLSERLLRRLRFQLIRRMLRFPGAYFRTTSQGELVAMITAESEPMGGLMGDAIAQPVFQFGQMMTIVAFLFVQSVWFGLAAVALFPLQAWLIPRLQRRINLLNKDRIKEVRRLASDIGESAAGIGDLRANGGLRYRLAQFTDRLGELFHIRLKIYRKKFFMKFLNNLITQVTPFLFYSIGGFLAIRGEITVGALVAALGAYKDLSAPWKELLFYYNQVQDMSLRWDIVTERFAPDGMIPETLVEGEPRDCPHLAGDIVVEGVTVLDEDGNAVLKDFSLTVPQGARIAVQSPRAAERAALAQLLVREILPARGRVTIAGHPLNSLHQAVIAARIGYVPARPYLFDGMLGDNLLMPLRPRPGALPPATGHAARVRAKKKTEAARTGNSPDPVDADWLDPGVAGFHSEEEVRGWWFRLAEAMGVDAFAFRHALRSCLDAGQHPDLAAAIVRLRPVVAERLAAQGLDRFVHGFDPERFNPALPLGGNLLFATPARELTQAALARETGFFRALDGLGLTAEGVEMAAGVIETLNRTFGTDKTDHPLFQRLGLSAEMYRRLTDIARRLNDRGKGRPDERERTLLLTTLFLWSAEQIGPGFPDRYRDKVLAIRKSHGARLLEQTGGLFDPLREDAFAPGLTVLENAVFGKLAADAGRNADLIEDVVADTLATHGLRRRLAVLVFDMRTGLGGANLPAAFRERAAFSRAVIKRPDILILDNILASHDPESRRQTKLRLRDLLPDTTMIFMEEKFVHPEMFDMVIDIREGRRGATAEPPEGAGVPADLARKLDAIAGSDLFGRLDAANRRLLAFSARWFEAQPGQVIFARGQPADAVFLCLSGRAELRLPGAETAGGAISFVTPGRLIGELGVITDGNRSLDLVATERARFLRIGAEEFRAVLQADANLSFGLLSEMARQLTGATELLHLARVDLADFALPADDRAAADAGEGRADA